MNCTKCGKEIPEGDNKICDDCQKKLLEDIVKEEKTELTKEQEVVEEKKEKKKNTKKDKANEDKKDDKTENEVVNDEVKETKKSKTSKVKKENKEEIDVSDNTNEKIDTKSEKKENEENQENQENQEIKQEEKEGKKGKNSFVIIICIAIILISLIIAILIDYNLSKKVGNTIGNIRNYGYTAIQGDWIYYLSPNEDSSNVGICKVRKDGTDKQTLLMEEKSESHEIVSINVSGDYIYYIDIITDETNEEDPYNNKVYRMKTDGSNIEVINDNELNNDCYEIYVVNGYVYYIDEDANIAKMKLDGSKKSVVKDNGTGYLGLTEEYIVFNKLKEGSETDYVTYIMDINGENERPIIKDKRLYSVNVEAGYVYYTTEEKKIYRTQIDSNTEELVCDTEAYNLNVNNGYVYYLNYLDAANQDYTVCIFKTDVNPVVEGQEKEIINLKKLDTYSSFLNIAGDWALYMDSNETHGVINMVKIDGSETIVELYSIDFEKYYDSLVPEDTTSTTTEPEENSETNTVVTENTVTNTTAVTDTNTTNTVTNAVSN